MCSRLGYGGHFPISLDKSEDAPQQYYGLSFYDRIFPVDYHTGLFGHWLQAPNSHPAVGISSIEGDWAIVKNLEDLNI